MRTVARISEAATPEHRGKRSCCASAAEHQGVAAGDQSFLRGLIEAGKLTTVKGNVVIVLEQMSG